MNKATEKQLIWEVSLNCSEKGQPVYIHCWGGRGRTGTVVGCWLIRHGIAEEKTVLEKISELRRFDPRAHFPSPEMPGQIRMVLSWKKGQ
jgi:protein-tyrosine phosphatase